MVDQCVLVSLKGMAQDGIPCTFSGMSPETVRRELFTIGYQLRSFSSFLALLRGSNVSVVFDVRDTAWSYRKPYRSTALEEALAAAEIRYVHTSFVGNPRSIRRAASDHSERLALYDEHLAASPQIVEMFSRLLTEEWTSGGTPCVMCYERHPDDCHRSLLLARVIPQLRVKPALVHLETTGAPRLTGASV